MRARLSAGDTGRASRARARRSVPVLIALATVTLATACFGPFARDSATPTPIATATPAPTPPPTATPEPVPTRPPAVGRARIMTDDLNVRVGPGRQYPVVGRLHTGDEVGVSGLSADEQWLALDGLGWTFHDESWIELDIPPGELPTVGIEASVAPTHPPGTDSGFPLINELADELAANDVDALSQRLSAAPVPCANAVTVPPGPPCPTGASAGDPVETIAVLGCTLEWAGAAASRDVAQRFLEPAYGTGAPGLYAVIAAGNDEPNATYIVLFAFPTGEARALWLGDSGAIPRVALGCDPAEPAGYLLGEIVDVPVYYVGPYAPAPLTPAR